MKIIESPQMALTEALVLAVTAPTKAKASKAIALAEHFATGLNPTQIEAAKLEAQLRAGHVEAL